MQQNCKYIAIYETVAPPRSNIISVQEEKTFKFLWKLLLTGAAIVMPGTSVIAIAYALYKYLHKDPQ